MFTWKNLVLLTPTSHYTQRSIPDGLQIQKWNKQVQHSEETIVEENFMTLKRDKNYWIKAWEVLTMEKKWDHIKINNLNSPKFLEW